MSTIHVPKGFSWVVVSLLSIVVLLLWQAINVGVARGKAKIRYPRAYAEKAEQEASSAAMVFNCKQRAHQNTLEFLPIIVTVTLISSLHYPLPAAAGCGLWTVSRVLYTLGYGTGDPSKRLPWSLISITLHTLLFIPAGKVVFDLIKAGV
ncbi:hypothetical protein BGW80DRAFT_1295493 [Lactifluus volemus]|nr:hypothetical protein BGW80DRAFT_1295493 [Lactifluus volemus]